MTNNTEIGKIGENIACKYLREKKYKIVKRNYREKFDEIDIIGKSFDGILVFIEVKTINLRSEAQNSIFPEDNLTKDKFKKISRACSVFSAKHPQLMDFKKGSRIDLVAIILIKEKLSRITHYKNIQKI